MNLPNSKLQYCYSNFKVLAVVVVISLSRSLYLVVEAHG